MTTNHIRHGWEAITPSCAIGGSIRIMFKLNDKKLTISKTDRGGGYSLFHRIDIDAFIRTPCDT